MSYYGKGEKTLGIFAHADVVAVENDWIYTKPFEPLQKDGCIIGRGALDNKSAVLISLYCAKIFKELDIPFESRLVMFTGSNEESGMEDVKHYISSHTTPDFSLVADTAFPIGRGNKGKIVFYTESSEKLTDVISLNGGTGGTVVGTADITFPYSTELYSEIKEHVKERMTVECDDKYIVVKAKGIPRHSASPEGTVSALALLTNTLAECKTLNKDVAFLKSLYNMSSCHYGECFGIESDDGYGKLTCVLTQIETVNGKLKANFNIRYGDSMETDEILSKIRHKLMEANWTEPKGVEYSLPDKLPAEDIYVNALLKVYENIQGVTGLRSYINAGGTYRQYLHSAVETGPALMAAVPQGMPAGHGEAHQPDECISIEGLLQAIEVTALMLLEADKVLNR